MKVRLTYVLTVTRVVDAPDVDTAIDDGWDEVPYPDDFEKADCTSLNGEEVTP